MLAYEHRAEHVGFEPTDAVTRINALAVRPNRPLWQCSARHSTGFIRHLQRRGQPIYGLTCPMRSRRGSNPLIPFRGLTCVPSMRLTVRPLLLGRHTVVLHAGSRRFHLWMCARRSHSDSNRGNRSHGSTVFKIAAFSRSAMTPLNAHLIRLRLRIICACQCTVNGESRDFPIFPPFGSVRLPGFEPGSRADYRDEDLNLARLPVPPQAR